MSRNNGSRRVDGQARKDWLRSQALAAAQKTTTDSVQTQRQQQAKQTLEQIVKSLIELNGRVARLSQWHAERCARIVELRAELHQEWEQRVAAEERVQALENELKSSGSPETVPPVVRKRAKAVAAK